MMMRVILLFIVVVACGRREADDGARRGQLIAARTARIDALARSCHASDWPQLVLIAADKWDWHDRLALASSDLDLIMLRCHALVELSSLRGLVPTTPSHGVHRHYAAAFNDPSVLAELELMLEQPNTHFPVCIMPPDAFVTELMQIAPLHRLRGVLAKHAPKALPALDADHSAGDDPRALRIEAWAAELTPDGFARVLDALAPDYNWNDGSPPPTSDERQEIEAHAAEMLLWLGALVQPVIPTHDCESVLRAAIANGPLGSRLLARLDHANPEIRHNLLFVLGQVAPQGSLERMRYVAEHDADDSVRASAKRLADELAHPEQSSSQPE